MIYLTFTNEYSGVYESQVLDVCRFLKGTYGVRARVVSLVSLRVFRRERRRLRRADVDVFVIPMVPGISRWKWNAILLYPVVRALGDRAMIGRSEFAANLGLVLRDWGALDTVVFDGRSARAAEVSEYVLDGRPVFSSDEIAELERRAVRKCDFRISVSSRLVDYWRERYTYRGENHAVIPCTLSTETEHPSSAEVITREDLRISGDATVLVYAGSSSQWQSFDAIDDLVCQAMLSDPRVVLLLLSDIDPEKLRVHREFPERVVQRWVAPSAVSPHLMLADYGLLLREGSVTNSVSCPTKFAEYLAAGLSVIISENVGDLTEFVMKRTCGVVLREGQGVPVLPRLEACDRRRNRSLALTWFTKEAHRSSYDRLVDWLRSMPDEEGKLNGVGPGDSV